MMYGIGKVAEETGELQEALAIYEMRTGLGRLQQLIGKAIPFPVGDHPDGKGAIIDRLIEEMADVRAAISYFALINLSPAEIATMDKRGQEKLDKFAKWGLTGIPAQPVERQS